MHPHLPNCARFWLALDTDLGRHPACLQAALDYLGRGWSPIPLCPPDHKGVSGIHETQCKSPGKVPLWPWGKYQVTPASRQAVRHPRGLKR